MLYKRSGSGRIAVLLIAFMLMLSFSVPVNAAGEDHWYDSISSMLSEGEYEEGVVIAGIDMSKAKRPEDPGSALETKKLRSSADEIMTVDPGAVEQRDFPSWFQQLKNGLTDPDADSVCITAIRRSDMTTEQILRMLAADDSVVFAEPNYTKRLESVGGGGSCDGTGEAAANAVIKDASALQWSSSENVTLHAANKTGDVSMKVPGFPNSPGENMSNEIIVAVVDAPVDFDNPDLENAAFTFTEEQQRELECDVHGYNALWDRTSTKLEYELDADHGTHVAGIIGASWDNRGISGVGSRVKIISVQNCRKYYTSLIDSLRGYSFIKKAIDKGINIRIVNNSWGLQQSSKALDAAVTELGEHGVVSFFSAGNDGNDLNALSDLDSMLGNNPYAVIVASTKPDGTISDFSSYGRGIVTLGAPGECMLSCIRPADAKYIPVMSGENKVYEGFEDSDTFKVNLCQIGYDKDGKPNPDDVVDGTGGSVVGGTDEPGFEGEKALKINFRKNKTYVGVYGERYLALKLDFTGAPEISVGKNDNVGFAFGGDGAFFPVSMEITGNPQSRTDNNYQFYNYPGSWGSYSYTLTGDIGTGDSYSFICQIVVSGEVEEIYLDAVGIGAERQPYAFLSGTSMATPAAAGAAAVIASRHKNELVELEPAASAKKLASLVRSSVRPNASLAGITSTGGIIDLTVDENRNSRAETPGPDITDLTVSGKTVTLTGSDFGETQGSVKLSKYVLGAPSDVDSSIVSWSDSGVVLTLGKDFEGIIEAVLTASNGKEDTIVRYISKSSNIFEKEHHIGSDTGEPFEFNEPGLSDPDAFGDFETTAILAAGDGRLWYLPKTAKVEGNAACRNMYSYDPGSDSWEECPALPKWLRVVSGTWFDGRIYVKGTDVYTDESGNIPYYNPEDGEPSTTRVYSFKPGGSSWTECSSEGAAPELTLFAAGGKLMLAGATSAEYYEYESSGRYPSVREYDPVSGAGQPLGFIPCAAFKPKAAYAGGHIYLSDYKSGDLFVLNGSLSAGEEDVIGQPEFYLGGDYKSLREYDPVLLSYGDMLILTGPAAKDGPSDTFMLCDGESSLRPFARRVSDAKVHMPAAAVLDGRLYVIAASAFEPGMRIFRSTALTEPDAEDHSSATPRDKKGSGSSGAHTGDESDPAAWAVLAAAAAMCLIAMAVMRRRREW